MPFRAILKYVLLVAIIAATAGGYMLSRLDLNSLRPPIADKVKEVTGRDFEIAGALKLDIGISPAIVLEDVRLQNAMFGTRAEMIKARKLEAHFALLPLLLGRIEINRLALVGPDILLETDEQGRSNWDFSRDDEPAYAPRPASVENAALELPKLGAVSITNGLFTYRNGMTGRTTKIAVTRFTGRSSSRDAPLVIDLTAAYDGTPFRVAGRLGAFVTLGGPGAFPVDLTAVVSDVQFALKGTVNRPLAPTSSKLSVIINSKNLNALEPLLKVTLPDRPMIFAGQVATEHGVLTVTDIKAKLGDSDLQGRLRLAPGKERRLLTASLNSRHLDLADVLIGDATPDNGAKAAGNGQERVEDERLFSDAPLLPYDLLELVDAAVDAKMDRLVMGRVTLSQAALTAKLKDGQLHIDPLSAVLAEGQMNGSVVLDSADRGRAKVSLQLLGVDMRLLSQSFDSSNIISGKMDVSAILAGRGASLRALMASLDGKTSIVMGKGQLKSSYADLMGADLFRFAAAGETTQVNCLVGRFDIAKGLIASHDILFDTGQMTIKGEGEISLSDEKFDLTFTTSPKESVVDLSAPWRVSGPLQRPKVDGDIASTLFSAINPFDGTDAENLCIAALAAPRPAGQPAAKPVVRPAKQDADAFRDAPENSMRD